MLSALGHNPVIAIRGLTGEASLREGTLEGEQSEGSALAKDALKDASVILHVDAGSLQLKDNVAERDRREIERNMQQEVLDTDRFPEIEFATTRVELFDGGASPYSVNLEGNLTLHGQTRAQTIPAKVTINQGTMRAFGEFSLLQTDYGIRPVAFAGGTLKIKDEVKLKFDLVARRRDPAAEEVS
jgi:polyisoprenoid-binding protein YceI